MIFIRASCEPYSSIARVCLLARYRIHQFVCETFQARRFEFSLGTDREPVCDGSCDVRHGVLNFTRCHAHTCVSLAPVHFLQKSFKIVQIAAKFVTITEREGKQS
jgi:hypothetical protein